MIFYILTLLKTSTIRQSFISFVGTFITGLLGLVFYSYLARRLGPSDFGIFSLSVTSIALVSSMANVGVDTGVIRFVSEAARERKKRALGFLKLAFEIKLIVWLVVLVLGYLLMPFLTVFIFSKPELVLPLRIALFGVGGTLFSSFALASLQAYSKFAWWSIVNVGANVVRFLSVFVLGLSGVLAVENALWVYSGVLFVLFFFIIFKLLPSFWFVTGERKLMRVFLGYNKWVAAFTGISAVGSRLDTYISARFLTLSSLGSYSVGVTLVSFVSQIVLALGSVVAPKLSGMKDRRVLISYLTKLQVFVFILAVGGLVIGIPLGYFFIPLIYGNEYLNSVSPFGILLAGQAIFLLAVPAHMVVIYHFSYPKLFVYVTLIRLVLTLALGFYLIPLYGATGAAVTVFIGNVSDFLIPVLWVVRKLNK